MQTEVKICPLCEQHNAADAAACTACGAPLNLTGVTTIYLDGQAPIRHIIEEPAWNADVLATLPEGTVALLVLGQAVPVVVKDQPVISLGRHIQGEPPPIVDLGEYHAHLLGVSRRHAVIRKVAEGYVIEDLNSHNGTWLNEARLPTNQAHLLMNGDTLRLGQLVLRVYFT